MTQKELLIDCLFRFYRTGLQYMVTGTMASNFWGLPRSTHDIDFMIALNDSTVPLIVEEFERDFSMQRSDVESGLRPPHRFSAIDSRSSLRVVFWVLAQNQFKREMFRRSICGRFNGFPASVPTAEDVLLHKLILHKKTPSDLHLQDAAGVWTVQGRMLNRERLEKHADRIGVRSELALILRGLIGPKQT